MVPFIVKKETGDKFFWNIDANVGVASPNRVDDVHLIQFGYLIMSTAQATDPGLKPIFAAVKVGVPCTGREDDPLVKAIRAHQKGRGGPQDGHVSKLKTSETGFAPGHAFMLVAILNNIFDATAADFPRIDRHPLCPESVRTAVRNACQLAIALPPT